MANKNMTLQEWNELCNERGIDPTTGGKAGVVFVHFTDEIKKAAEFDAWAEDMRAREKSAATPPPKPKWRLRWVNVA